MEKAKSEISLNAARKKKELKALVMKEMKFLPLNANLADDPAKAAIIRKRQAKIMGKFQNADDDKDSE